MDLIIIVRTETHMKAKTVEISEKITLWTDSDRGYLSKYSSEHIFYLEDQTQYLVKDITCKYMWVHVNSKKCQNCIVRTHINAGPKKNGLGCFHELVVECLDETHSITSNVLRKSIFNQMSSSKLVMEAFKKLPSFNNRREISKELNCKSELKRFSFTTSHCCGTLLQDFKYPQSKKTYFMSSSAISSMKLPLRNCTKCTTLFYPDFQDMGLLHFHNKVPTSYYVMMNFLICFPI